MTTEKPLALTLLVRVGRMAEQTIEQALTSEGISVSQFLVLDMLANKQGQSMTEISENTAISPPTLTRIIDKLVSIATVYREIDVIDRRRFHVYISARGRHLHRRSSAQVISAAGDLTDRLTLDLQSLRSFHS